MNNRDEDKIEKAPNESESKEDMKSAMGVAASIDSAVEDLSADVSARYFKPEYDRDIYDINNKHNTFKNRVFAEGGVVRDPYSGDVLVKSKAEAKMLYGEEWQDHLAEADHIDPLNGFVKRASKNPFLTQKDVKEIGNADDNYQLLSRKLNQNSKPLGKGGSTQEEWANDPVRMQGLSERINTGESIDEVSKRIVDTGKAAEKRNNSRAMMQSMGNAATTFHEAGLASATGAGATALTMSSILNIVAVIKGEKRSEEALADTLATGGKAVVFGYTMGGGLTVLNQILSYSSSQFIQALAANNVPSKVLTSIMITGQSLEKWGKGEITTEELIIEIGEKGIGMLAMAPSMAIGQCLIPVPVIGSAVGALVGTFLAETYFDILVQGMQTGSIATDTRLCQERDLAARYYSKWKSEYNHFSEKYLDSETQSNTGVYRRENMSVREKDISMQVTAQLEKNVVDFVNNNQALKDIELKVGQQTAIKGFLDKIDPKVAAAISSSGTLIADTMAVGAIGGLFSSTTTLGFKVFEKYKAEGKSFSQFTDDDWAEILQSVGISFTQGAAGGAVIHLLVNEAGMGIPVAGAIVSAAFGVGSLLIQLNNGDITFDEFLVEAEIVCIDAAIVAGGAALGQLAIPVPGLGAFVGALAGSILVWFIEKYFGDKERELLDKLNKTIEALLKTVGQELYSFIRKLQDVSHENTFLEKLFRQDANIGFVLTSNSFETDALKLLSESDTASNAITEKNVLA